jgi:hypothetical protein
MSRSWTTAVNDIFLGRRLSLSFPALIMLLTNVDPADIFQYQQFSSDLTVIADTYLGLELLRIAW